MASVPVMHGFPRFGDYSAYGGHLIDPIVDSHWAPTRRGDGARLLAVPVGVDIAIPTAREWWCWEGNTLNPHAGEADAEGGIIGMGFNPTQGWSVRQKFEDASPPTTYRPRLYYNDVFVAEGGNDLAVSTYQSFRRTWLPGQVTLEIDGVYEINVATDHPIGVYGYVNGGGVGPTSTASRIRKLLIVRGDGSADRPSATPADRIFTAIESASNGTFTAWKGTNLGDWEEIDDWVGGGAEDDDTTYIIPDGMDEVKETYNPAGVPTIGAGVTALHMHGRTRLVGAPGGSKTLAGHLIYDGANERSGGMGSTDGTGWVNRSWVFTKAPDNGVWTQGDLNNLEFGVIGQDPLPDITIRVTAIVGEFVEYALDAGDPPALDKPRSFGTII